MKNNKNHIISRAGKVLLGLFLPIFSFSQSHYPGQHAGKFAIADKLKPAVYAFDLNEVRLLPSRFTENMEREQAWLLSIDVNQLLHSFRNNAGVFAGNEGGYFAVKKLGGWESLDCELRGHTTGHILSGLAMMYGTTGDDKWKKKADSLVTGLAQVQKALNQGGYLAAFPQELINRNLEAQKVWAPWYTEHKILSGLIDQYLYCNNQHALDVAKGMAAWAYQKLKPVTGEQRTKMLRNEFGGINESFYNLYAITGNAQDKWLADFFYQNETLDPLKQGKDILDTKHANTYIPKLLGTTRDYELEGKGEGDSIATFFWNTVVNHHSFATGSNSDKEHFFKPDDLADHLSGYTGESCNVYNMLKLTRHLYTHTGNIRYADYYEKALYNHILGQQDPATGMIAYFLPMKPGSHKVYSTPDSSFWCCVGSGFENQAKYGESIYYHTADALFVNLFIPSRLDWEDKGLQLKQETAFPQNGAVQFIVENAPAQTMSINIRYPQWATGATVQVNGKNIVVKHAPDSYITIRRKWKGGDTITVDFGMQLHTVVANDDARKVAILYGPIVLAGEMGTENFEGREPYSDPLKYNDYYTYDYHVPNGMVTALPLDTNAVSKTVQPVAGKPLTFSTTAGITLRPLYDIHRQRYVVYWDIK